MADLLRILARKDKVKTKSALAKVLDIAVRLENADPNEYWSIVL